jgi:hypothetical protein
MANLVPRRLPPQIRERSRQRSKNLFGNRDRLEVAVAIALSPDGVVNATDLAIELALPNTRVRSQLIALREAGLLIDTPAQSWGKRWYVRREHPFWQTCVELFDEWIHEASDLLNPQ